MYVHPAFKVDDGEALAMLRDRAFGLLVVTTPAAPVAVHVPFLVDEQADSSLRVALHVARANALHSHIGQGSKALLVCAGPDAYISPDWYGVPNQVPTWTYTSVHLAGTVRLMPERGLLAHVDRLSAYFENRLLPKQPWSSAKMDEARRAAMLKAIVGIEMEVESIAAQNKLSAQGTDRTLRRHRAFATTWASRLDAHCRADAGGGPPQIRGGVP